MSSFSEIFFSNFLDLDTSLCRAELRQVQQGRCGRGGDGGAREYRSHKHRLRPPPPSQGDHAQEYEG